MFTSNWLLVFGAEYFARAYIYLPRVPEGDGIH